MKTKALNGFDAANGIIRIDFRISVRVIAGKELITDGAMRQLEDTLLEQIAGRLGHNVISGQMVAFEVVKTERI